MGRGGGETEGGGGGGERGDNEAKVSLESHTKSAINWQSLAVKKKNRLSRGEDGRGVEERARKKSERKRRGKKRE